MLALFHSNKVECAGLCLSEESCYALDFDNKTCKLIYHPDATFDVETDKGPMTICLDHQDWKPRTIYADNRNIPPMCPSKCSYFFLKVFIHSLYVYYLCIYV